MRKIWIIYDTKYGNNVLLANNLKKMFQGVFLVKSGYAKKIKPKKVLEDHPYGLIIGGPIRFGNPSLTIKKWITDLGKRTQKIGFRPKKIALYCSALNDIDRGQGIFDLAADLSIAEEIYPKCMGLLVEDLKVPFKSEGMLDFTAELRLFFNKH